MRIKITLFLVLITMLVRAAQDPSSALLLQSGIIYPTANTTEFAASTIASDEVIDGFYFRIVQFSVYPDQKLQEEIAAAGIILNNYLPYRSYNCAIPVSFDKNKAASLKINSVLKWENTFKLSRKINGQDIPSHCIIEKGHADLVVHCQQNLSFERTKTLMTTAGFRIIGMNEAAKSITIRLPFEKLNQLTSLSYVYFVEAISMPSTPDDTEGRSLHRSNVINSDVTTGRHYDGSGVVIGLADDGEIGPHIDFTGRVVQHLSGTGGSHGDMTAGICVGAGNLIPRIRGMATGSTIHIYDIGGYPQIVDAVSNYQNYGIVITSTSYAQNCNEYNSDSQFGDQLINENSEFNFCFSAGNAGTTDCGYGAGSDWGNITGGYKMGKNVIAVANLRNTDQLESSSSRGPAVDGRLKPDIASNGYDQRSTDEGNTYQTGGGTSAACPGVAGCLGQLYQAYKELNSTSQVPSGLLKACILNTAQDLGNPGPDFKFGYGRINAFRALTTLEDHRYFMDSITQGQTKTHSINVPAGTTQMRVMVYWHDIEGAVASLKNLVNDINMTVTQSALTYQPLVLDPTPVVANLDANAVPGNDSLNNSEQIRIANPAAGTYTVNIDGFQVPVGTQKYFVVYEFYDNSITVTFPNGGEAFTPAAFELIRWDATDTIGPFSVDYSDDGGANWNNIASGISGTDRYTLWTPPVMAKDQMLIRVSNGTTSDVSDSMFTLIRIPTNLHVTFVCPDSIGLAWSAVPNATGYDVSMLGAKYMDYMGTSTNTSITITGTNPSVEHWFSVKALGPNGGKGQRADAIYMASGLLNCALAIDGELQITSPTPGLLTDCGNLTAFPVSINIMNSGTTAISNFEVKYSLNNGAVVTETFAGSIPFTGNAPYTFTQTLSLTPGIHTLNVWVSINGDQNVFNDSVTVTFEIVTGTPGTLNTVEPFTSFNICATSTDCGTTICAMSNGWINATNATQDDIDWRTNSGATPSNTTGPSMDHTNGAGKYIYLEASSCSQNEAILLSPCFDLTGTINPAFTFWYHMYGADMGELHVDVIANDGLHPDVIPARSGDQGDLWKKDSVMLSQFIGQTISIRFRGITGSDYASDMALDDIGLFEIPLSVNDNILQNSIRIYPNPSNGLFNYSMNVSEVYDLRVYDVLGNVVLSQNISGRGTIDLSTQSAGVYTAVIYGEKGKQEFKLMNIAR